MIGLGTLLTDEEKTVLFGADTAAHGTQILGVGVLVRLAVVNHNFVR